MLRFRSLSLLFFAMAVTVSRALPVAAQTQTHAERKIVEKVAPAYPALAERTNVRGVVKLEVTVRPNGSVKSIKVTGGNPVLLDSAVEAVRKWKFETVADETVEAVRVSFEPR